MRYTVTPLGSATGRPVDAVIDDLVHYLRDTSRTMAPAAEVPALATVGAPGPAPSGGVAAARRYYADSGDGPGVWRGLGAAALGLSGEVDDEAFTHVLAGKHPATGEPLLNHQPTRASTAKVAAVLDGDPAEELTLAQAAQLTGLSVQYLRRVCRNWERRRAQIEATIAAGQRPSLAYLVSTRTANGHRVSSEELAAFLIRRRPPTVRIGFDVTLTTEKSLGVLGLLCPPAVRAAVLEAIAAGNDVGLDYFEQHAAWARRKGKRVGVQGWTVASFRHLTSRALDPFPHHHNVVANLVTDEHRDVRALDGRGLYHYARDASILATVEMRYRLTASLGVDWDRSPTGKWEIAGIPHAAIREFSRRSNEIAEAVHELEQQAGRPVTIDELRRVVTATRPTKQHTDPDQLAADWWRRAQRVGLSHDA